jgi:2,4-dienoyl-CoA reductase-like NADH-dependent reductase (Old Yellow Enzyme family)
MMSKILSPLDIKAVTLKNRIVISPMCQYSAADGFANDWHFVHLGSRAVGGAGLIIQEATAVAAEGRITPGDLGIYREDHVDKLQSITGFIIEHGAIPGIQLAHAGRKAGCAVPWEGGHQLNVNEGGWRTFAPSAIPFNPENDVPHALDKDEILKVVEAFKTAAFRSLTAGYKVLEIHAAHGYLIHQFLSPLSNHRTDNYGGSLENRSRLLLEIVRAIQTVWPQHLPLFVRISATDWVDGGWGIDEAVQLSSILKIAGVDLIDCSSGGLVPYAKIPFGPSYQVPFAERIKKESGILTGAVGLITEIRQAEDILEREAADLILFGRKSLREPYLAFKAATLLEEDITWPLQYMRAKLK